MFFSKGQEVIDLVSSHSDKVMTCYKTYMDKIIKVLEGCDTDELEGFSAEIARIESEADAIRHDIIKKLLEGRLLVDSRKSIVRLIEGIDNVADLAEEIIREVSYQGIDQLARYKNQVLKINLLTYEQLGIFIEEFKSLITKYDMEKMIEISRKIELLESEVDQLEHGIIKNIYQLDLELAEKMHLQGIVNKIGYISDIIEDLSDEIEIVMMARKV